MNKTLNETAWFTFKVKVRKEWESFEYLKNKTEILDVRLIESPWEVGKKIKNQWPGIIFVKTKLENGGIPNEVRSLIVKTPNFTRIISYEKNYKPEPIFISQRQFDKILKNVEVKDILSSSKFKPEDIDFEINDVVLVTSGLFRGHEGEVVEIDYAIGKITINVEFFGRMTPTKVGFMECKKK